MGSGGSGQWERRVVEEVSSGKWSGEWQVGSGKWGVASGMGRGEWGQWRVGSGEWENGQVSEINTDNSKLYIVSDSTSHSPLATPATGQKGDSYSPVYPCFFISEQACV